MTDLESDADLTSLVESKKWSRVVDLLEPHKESLQDPKKVAWLRKALAAEGRVHDQAGVIELGVNRFPDSLEIRIGHAESSMGLKSWKEAAKRWQYIKDNFTDFPLGVYTRQAVAYLNAPDYEAALDSLDALAAIRGSETERDRDLRSLIDSRRTRRYQLRSFDRFLNESKAVHFEHIPDQRSLGRSRDFKRFRLRGWAALEPGERGQLVIAAPGSNHRRVVPFNKERPDVVRHFEQQQVNVALQCGFDIEVDLSMPSTEIEVWAGEGQLSVRTYQHRAVQEVLQGEDGWLYLANDTNRSIDQYVGDLVLGQEQLNDWEAYIQRLVTIGESQDLVFLIANSKESVVSGPYPYRRADTTVTDQVVALMERSGLTISHPLASLRGNQGTYYKTDTHWSDYGAYLAFLQVVPGLPDSHRQYFDTNIRFDAKSVVGDLGSKISPPMRAPKLTHRWEGPVDIDLAFSNLLPAGTGRFDVYVNKHALLPEGRVVLFGGSSLRSGSFSRFALYLYGRVVVVNLPGSYLAQVVALEHPDLVIVQTNERYLIKPGKVYEELSGSPVGTRVAKLSPSERPLTLRAFERFTSEPKYVDIFTDLIVGSR